MSGQITSMLLEDEKGLPIEIPAGPVDARLREKIEKALTNIVPENKKFAVAVLYDLGGNAIDAQVATRIGGNFVLGGAANWNDDKLSGFVGVNWSF